MTNSALTIKQSTWLDAYLATGNGAEACRRAGYSPTDSWKLRTNPKIKAEIQRRSRDTLALELAPLALWVARDLLSNSDNPVEQGRMSRFIIEASGVSLKGDKASAKDQKTLAECSLAELEQRARELEATVIKGPIIDAGAQGSAQPDDSDQ